MELNEKLQELRRKRGITQEELATAIFVSRTAVSKWESGRGYPNIDSLKAIAKYFSLRIDDLLSGDQIIDLAEENEKKKSSSFRDLFFGFLDVFAILLVFLPIFALRGNSVINHVSLLSENQLQPYLKAVYLPLLFAIALLGVFTLALQSLKNFVWVKTKSYVSLSLSAVLTGVFIVSLQAYASIFVFTLFVLKTIVFIKTK